MNLEELSLESLSQPHTDFLFLKYSLLSLPRTFAYAAAAGSWRVAPLLLSQYLHPSFRPQMPLSRKPWLTQIWNPRAILPEHSSNSSVASSLYVLVSPVHLKSHRVEASIG